MTITTAITTAADAAAAPPETALLHEHIRRVYLSGPMTGLPEFNYPAFERATATLRAAGYEVYNPATSPAGRRVKTAGRTGTESPEEVGFDVRSGFADYAEFITREADAICVLPGWENSRGARAEVALALAVGLPVIDATTGALIDVEISARTTTADPMLARPDAGRPDAVRPATGTSQVASPTASNGEIRTTSATGGQKGAKEAQFHLIPPGPLRELAVLYGRGAQKYEAENWKRGYSWSLSFDALLRHLYLWWQRTEDHDAEMGVKHLICVAWHAFNLAWMMENQPEFDDRPDGVAGAGESYAGALPTPQWILDRQHAAATDADAA